MISLPSYLSAWCFHLITLPPLTYVDPHRVTCVWQICKGNYFVLRPLTVTELTLSKALETTTRAPVT